MPYIYNNPKTSGFLLTAAFLRKLADVGVAGIKDSSFSFIDFSHFVLAMEDRPQFRLLAGSEALALPCWMIGAAGAVCGLANAFPELTVALWEAFQKKDYETAAELQLRVNRGRQILHIRRRRTRPATTRCMRGVWMPAIQKLLSCLSRRKRGSRWWRLSERWDCWSRPQRIAEPLDDLANGVLFEEM